MPHIDENKGETSISKIRKKFSTNKSHKNNRNVAQVRFRNVAPNKPPIAINLPHKIFLGVSKTAISSVIGLGLYSFLVHGKDQSLITRGEMEKFLITTGAFSFIGGTLETSLLLDPRILLVLSI